MDDEVCGGSGELATFGSAFKGGCGEDGGLVVVTVGRGGSTTLYFVPQTVPEWVNINETKFRKILQYLQNFPGLSDRVPQVVQNTIVRICFVSGLT